MQLSGKISSVVCLPESIPARKLTFCPNFGLMTGFIPFRREAVFSRAVLSRDCADHACAGYPEEIRAVFV